MKIWVAILLASACVISCIDPDDFNFDNLAKTSWNPEVGFPVVNSSLGVDRLFENTDTNVVTSDNDGLVTLQYISPSIEISVDEFFDMPASFEVATTSAPALPGQTVPLNFPITPASLATQMQIIEFETGTLSLGFNTGSSQIVTYEFPSIKTPSGSNLSVSVPMNVNSVNTDLSGHTLSLNSQGEVEFSITFPASASGTATPLIELTNVDYRKIQGDFGQAVVSLPKDSMKLHLFKNMRSEGKFDLVGPRLEVDINNSIGVPLQLDLSSMEGYNTVTNQTTKVFSSGGVFNLDGGSVSQPELSQIIIDRSNSDLADVIQPTPVFVQYEAEVTPNPNGTPNPLNTLEKGAGLEIDAGLKLPLHGSIRDLQIVDTVEFGVDEMFDLIREFVIATNVKNGFPLDIDLSLQLLDSAYGPLFTASQQPVYLIDNQRIFSSGVPDSDGRINQNTVNAVSNSYTMDQELLGLITKGKYIRIIGTFETYDQGSRPVKIFDDYKLDVKVGIKVVGNINF